MSASVLCLILGSGFLNHQFYSVNPDAVATAGVAMAAHTESEPGSLSIVLKGQRAERLREIATLAAGAEANRVFWAADCPESTTRTVIVGYKLPIADKGISLWLPEQLDAGGGPAPEISRALYELLDIPVARQVPPWSRRVSVLRLPNSVTETALLTAAFNSPWTSWISLEDSVYLVSENPEQQLELIDKHGAERLAQDVELRSLRLVGNTLPAGAKALVSSSQVQLAICPNECKDGTPWLESRFSQVVSREGVRAN